MKSFLTLSVTDFRSIFRGILAFPFVCFIIVRWGIPLIIEQFPILIPYQPVILMWGCLQSATMFGFIYGFLLLEEKEENVWQVIRVLPVSGLTLTFSRLLVGLLVSALVNFTLIHWGHIVQLSTVTELLLALQFGLGAPLIALWLGAMAQNRIEGLAQMKILNLLLISPGLIYFIYHPAAHLTGLVPTYWSFRSMETGVASTGTGLAGPFLLYYSLGCSFYALVLYLLNRKLQRSFA
ncbi:hypothetical protein GCM10023187_20620 [Nibrella viscosa]|uniref:Fluoroquinolone transport system permease protein n=1 Tax=Nibrella viscosa TaxID=1084524 RepID=A0ABP8KD64_9BACT